jgi:hypothetical protein
MPVDVTDPDPTWDSLTRVGKPFARSFTQRLIVLLDIPVIRTTSNVLHAENCIIGR